jgi:hypothetical protein
MMPEPKFMPRQLEPRGGAAQKNTNNDLEKIAVGFIPGHAAMEATIR